MAAHLFWCNLFNQHIHLIYDVNFLQFYCSLFYDLFLAKSLSVRWPTVLMVFPYGPVLRTRYTQIHMNTRLFMNMWSDITHRPSYGLSLSRKWSADSKHFKWSNKDNSLGCTDELWFWKGWENDLNQLQEKEIETLKHVKTFKLW